jgi:hypothetical protein
MRGITTDIAGSMDLPERVFIILDMLKPSKLVRKVTENRSRCNTTESHALRTDLSPFNYRLATSRQYINSFTDAGF